MTDQFTWSVDVTLPKDDEHRWVRNAHFNVVCGTVERCIELVRVRHSGCVIIAIHRTGRDAQTIVDTSHD
jgi:hypothetical protein